MDSHCASPDFDTRLSVGVTSNTLPKWITKCCLQLFNVKKKHHYPTLGSKYQTVCCDWLCCRRPSWHFPLVRLLSCELWMTAHNTMENPHRGASILVISLIIKVRSRSKRVVTTIRYKSLSLTKESIKGLTLCSLKLWLRVLNQKQTLSWNMVTLHQTDNLSSGIFSFLSFSLPCARRDKNDPQVAQWKIRTLSAELPRHKLLIQWRQETVAQCRTHTTTALGKNWSLTAWHRQERQITTTFL